ncbi:MAG TPA: MarR family transcriptional regulator [Solirubrobacterales bacterium]
MAQASSIDELVGQWRAERPDLDLDAMATVARLLHLGAAVRRELGALAAEYDVLVPEADILFTLRRSGPPYRLLPSELSEALLVSSGTLTNRLDRLESKGLVERHPNPDDRRSVEVALTEPGRRLADEAVTAHVENERRMLAALSPPERKALDELTSKLLAGLAEEG